jgi:hypothetical protein
MALLCNVHGAGAASLTIECEKQDTMVPDWAGPLTISYPGGASGDVAVKSEYVTFSLPATETETPTAVDGTERTSVVIVGSGEASSVLPDPQALKACIDGALQSGQADDPDKQRDALLGCMPKVAMGSSPIGVQAKITVIVGGLLPGDDPDKVFVQIQRAYADVRTASGAEIAIKTSADDCKLAGQ